MSEPAKEAQGSERPVPPTERVGGHVTQLIRLGGLVVALNEVLLQKDGGSTHGLLLGAFMMAGAQGLDSFLTAFFGGKK